MEIEKLNVNNFLSYRSQEIEFKESGLILIEGKNKDEGDSNGSGKSSLWDGISFALFGQTVRGLKGDDVINRKFKKECWVNLRVKSFGNIYELFRYRKHSEFGDRLFIIDINNDKQIELGTLAQTQQWILDTFQIDFDLFRCTVLFAQGETFNFVDAGNKSQKEILSKVMKVNYDKYLSNSKLKMKQLIESINMAERDLVAIEAKLDIDFEEIQDNIIEWDEGRSKRLRNIKEESDKHLLDKEELEKEYKPTEKIKKAIVRVVFDVKAKTHARSDIEAQQAEYRSKMNYFQEDLARAQELEKQGECPHCRSKVTCLNQEWMRDSESRAEEFTKLYKEKRVEAGIVTESIDEMEGKLDKLRALLSQQESVKSKIERLEDKILYLEGEYSKKELEKNPYEDELEKKKKYKEELEEKLLDKNKEIDNYKKLMPFYEFWMNAFGDAGIKSFVFDLICSNLTNKANNYLNTLSGGAFSISFDTQKMTKGGDLREKFDCVIHKDGEKVDYASYSGGEKRRISLAVDMALSDIMSDYHGSKFNVVVFDEQDSYLDDQGRKQYLKLLKDLSKDKNVFVVAHDSQFKGYFDKTIVIEKTGGISRIL